MEVFSYTPSELEQATTLLARSFLPDTPSSHPPIVSILGGQPASGKSELIRIINKEHPDRVVVNGDDYRKYHPRYGKIVEQYGQDAARFTQHFSNECVEFMKRACFKRKHSFIIEGTMRNYSIVEDTARQARSQGFRVEAHLLAVSANESYLGIYQRYEGELERDGWGRFSPLKTHDEAYRNIPVIVQRATNERLFDKLKIYQRTLDETLTIAHQVDFSPKFDENSYDFIVLFEKLREPLYSNEYYLQEWKEIKEKATDRGEKNPNYLNSIDDFIRSFS